MLLSSFLGWWYLSGWGWLIKQIGARMGAIAEIFSVPILLRTLFAPWKQIRTATNFHNFFQSIIDNTISRLIGAVVRLGMLFLALVCWTLLLVFGILALAIWPFIPLGVFILPFMAISGVGTR